MSKFGGWIKMQGAAPEAEQFVIIGKGVENSGRYLSSANTIQINMDCDTYYNNRRSSAAISSGGIDANAVVTKREPVPAGALPPSPFQPDSPLAGIVPGSPATYKRFNGTCPSPSTRTDARDGTPMCSVTEGFVGYLDNPFVPVNTPTLTPAQKFDEEIKSYSCDKIKTELARIALATTQFQMAEAYKLPALNAAMVGRCKPTPPPNYVPPSTSTTTSVINRPATCPPKCSMVNGNYQCVQQTCP
jgi:hypothetical protein